MNYEAVCMTAPATSGLSKTRENPRKTMENPVKKTPGKTMGVSTNERPGSDYVTWGPIRGLEKSDMKRGQIYRYINWHRDSMKSFFLKTTDSEDVFFQIKNNKQIYVIYVYNKLFSSI